MARTKAVLKTEPFTNSLKQTLNPGDCVVVVTSGYNHNISIRRGIYLGTKNGNASCQVEVPTSRWRFIETKVDVGTYDWPKYPDSSKLGGYRSEEYQAAAKAYKEESARFRETIETYPVIHKRNTTLQLNRVFKIDTSVFDLKI